MIHQVIWSSPGTLGERLKTDEIRRYLGQGNSRSYKILEKIAMGFPPKGINKPTTTIFREQQGQ